MFTVDVSPQGASRVNFGYEGDVFYVIVNFDESTYDATLPDGDPYTLATVQINRQTGFNRYDDNLIPYKEGIPDNMNFDNFAERILSHIDGHMKSK